MSDRRIAIINDQQERIEAGTSPLLTSVKSPWEGYLIEVHNLPAGELPSNRAVFENHMIFAQIGAEPYRKYWRENGFERSAEVIPGDIALCSQQELVGVHWDKPFEVIGLAINDATAQNAIGDASDSNALSSPWKPPELMPSFGICS